MSDRIYQRGRFWLATETSKILYICWYDKRSGKVRRKSTRTSDVSIASDALDTHYLAHTRPEKYANNDVLLRNVLTDYYVEHGSGQISADAIKARLKHFADFIDHAESVGICDTFVVEDIDDVTLAAFWNWSSKEPIQRRNKAGEITSSSERSQATTNEAVRQLRAALNHAYRKRRIASVPYIKVLGRGEVSAPVKHRATISQIAEMLDYACKPRRKTLHDYLIAAICTLGRPEAILDMSIEPKWAQWDRDAKTFDLNPAGRKQTRKFRATVPVVDLLNRWLVDLEASDCPWFIRHNGQPIRSVHTAWNRMCDQLDLPREWNAKIIRHSMAAELRKRRVDAWELEGFMGHRKPSETETYAAYDPAYLGTVGAGICDIVSDLCASVPKALHPRYTQNSGKIAAIFPKKKEA